MRSVSYHGRDLKVVRPLLLSLLFVLALVRSFLIFVDLVWIDVSS